MCVDDMEGKGNWPTVNSSEKPTSTTKSFRLNKNVEDKFSTLKTDLAKVCNKI